nr:uncharacterized protein LOC129270209 [Lytechinus pictus]
MVAQDIDECNLEGACSNHGVCNNTNGDYMCSCEGGWGGKDCGTAITDCGFRPAHSSSSPRIIGGSPTQLGDWPWMVSLRDRSNVHRCAAVIINSNTAITAAHCIDKFETAVVGDLKLSSTSVYHLGLDIEGRAQHEDYNSETIENDIGIIKFKTPLNFTNDYIRPICLENENRTVYKECYVTGWGHSEEGGAVSDTLQEATVTLFNRSACQEFYHDRQLTQGMLCAGSLSGQTDACQGDTGGPLQCEDQEGRFHLVGITSFGYGCGRPSYPGVYTKVSYYNRFITTTTFKKPDAYDASLYRQDVKLDYTRMTFARFFPDQLYGYDHLGWERHYRNDYEEILTVQTEFATIIEVDIYIYSIEQPFDKLYIGFGDNPYDFDSIISDTDGEMGTFYRIATQKVWMRFKSDGETGGEGSYVTFQGKYITDSYIDYSVNCDFENSMCGWSRMKRGDADWYRVASEDHTFGNSSGHYITIEIRFVGGLISPRISPHKPLTFEFYYCLRQNGNLTFNIRYLHKANMTSEIIWSLPSAATHHSWLLGVVDISEFGSGWIIIEGTSGISIDDVSLIDSSLPFVGDDDSYIALLPDSPFYVTSPGFPKPYPSNITRTLQFRVQNRKGAHIMFESFSLEPVFDTLTIGLGPDPTDQSSVLYEFSQILNQRLISGVIPSQEFWLVFKSDWTVSGDGFKALLMATDQKSDESSVINSSPPQGIIGLYPGEYHWFDCPENVYFTSSFSDIYWVILGPQGTGLLMEPWHFHSRGFLSFRSYGLIATFTRYSALRNIHVYVGLLQVHYIGEYPSTKWSYFQFKVTSIPGYNGT